MHITMLFCLLRNQSFQLCLPLHLPGRIKNLSILIIKCLNHNLL